MTLPLTYSDWVAILERFGNGDDAVLEEMNAGRFTLDAGTAQRFYSRIEEAYKKRKQKWLDKFQHSFQMQIIRTDDDFGIVLRNGKQNLLPLLRFVSSNSVPENLRKALQNDLDMFVADIKKSLKDGVSKGSSRNEKRLTMLNTFGLPEIKQEEPVQKKTINKNEGNNSTLPAGRKIIF